ncbi:MAG: hypothetical protein Q7S85_04890 [Rugosibacter sp.]|nr:hypothetical protein [Rugosibacter sp.]
MKTGKSLVLAALSPAFLLACTPLTPHLDSHFGEAVNMVKAQQIINPDAARNPDPVSGVDGKSGQAAIDSYNKSFKTPPKTTISNTINVGGAGTGGTAGGQ